MDHSILETLKTTQALLSDSEVLGREYFRVTALRKKLENQSITVSVIGQFKRGKSALVNAILGENLLPVGIVPITSAVTEITYGEKNAAVHFFNGSIKTVKMHDLGTYINEQENPENVLGVSSVSLRTPSPFLKDGFTFVDTPGVGSFHKHNSDAAYAFVKESDAVIFMLSVDTPINEIEIDFLKSTRAYAAKFFFVVNKIDVVSSEELNAYLQYCRKLLSNLMGAQEIVLFPVSVKMGTGIEALKMTLRKECRARTREILEASVTLKLKDVIASSLAQIELYWKVLLMPPLVLAKSLRDIKTTLEELKVKAAEMVHEEEADREIMIPGLGDRLEVRMNELKIVLTSSVTELFGMDYHYALTELDLSGANGRPDKNTLAKELGDAFLKKVATVCNDLETTLNRVLLYRNDSTVEVVTRIYALNRLTRQLRRTKDLL